MEGINWYYVYDKDGIEAIKKYAKEYDLPFFNDSMTAIKYIKSSRLMNKQ